MVPRGWLIIFEIATIISHAKFNGLAQAVHRVLDVLDATVPLIKETHNVDMVVEHQLNIDRGILTVETWSLILQMLG